MKEKEREDYPKRDTPEREREPQRNPSQPDRKQNPGQPGRKMQ